MKKKGIKRRRKGFFILTGILNFIVFLILNVFAWDTARLLYYKVYNQNLASVVAISVVNESGYYYSDSTGTSTKGFLVTNHHFPGRKFPKGFVGTPADDPSFIKSLQAKNDTGSTDSRIVKLDLNGNFQNYDKFVTGANGVHGEARVTSTLEVDLLLSKVVNLGGTLGSPTKRITNVAVAIPLYTSEGSAIIDWNSITSGNFEYH